MGFSLLLLAIFLPPLALYLIVLGWINRRPHPVVTAGTWDFTGVLFALSGFLLVGGPAFLASLDEQSRTFWLLGVTQSAQASPAGNWTFWIVVRLIYYALVVGGAAFVLWRSRRLTSIYNVESRWIFTTVVQAYQRLGLNPLRYGDSFLIEARAEPVAGDAKTNVKRNTILRVDTFPPMRHATLCWEPADSPLRRSVEKELARLFAEAPAAEEEPILGGCLTLLGVSLFVFTCLNVAFMVFLRLLAAG